MAISPAVRRSLLLCPIVTSAAMLASLVPVIVSLVREPNPVYGLYLYVSILAWPLATCAACGPWAGVNLCLVRRARKRSGGEVVEEEGERLGPLVDINTLHAYLAIALVVVFGLSWL